MTGCKAETPKASSGRKRTSGGPGQLTELCTEQGSRRKHALLKNGRLKSDSWVEPFLLILLANAVLFQNAPWICNKLKKKSVALEDSV